MHIEGQTKYIDFIKCDFKQVVADFHVFLHVLDTSNHLQSDKLEPNRLFKITEQDGDAKQSLSKTWTIFSEGVNAKTPAVTSNRVSYEHSIKSCLRKSSSKKSYGSTLQATKENLLVSSATHDPCVSKPIAVLSHASLLSAEKPGILKKEHKVSSTSIEADYHGVSYVL